MNNFSSKKVLLAGWGCENPQDTYMYQIYYLTLQKIFPKIETFDTKKIYFQVGKEKMNTLLLNKSSEKDYDLVLIAMDYDELYSETIEKMKKNSPNAKLVLIVCDDDARFDSWSRFYSLFFDGVIQSPLMTQSYLKDKIDYSFFHFDYNTYKLEPTKTKKIYDVTFIGRPKADRYEIIKYLKEIGIKVGLFGWGWNEHSDLSDIYGGALSQEDYAKVINQSKISLNFTKAGFSEEVKTKGNSKQNHYNMKGRFFEVALCKGFQLIEEYPGIEQFFKNKKEVVLFNSREDLLKKVDYYLKHEKEREKIAGNSYKKTITTFNREANLKEIFTKIFDFKYNQKELPQLSKKIAILNKKDLFSKNLKEKLEKVDYISFIDKNLKNSSKFKNYFLARALQVTGKNISCCDYYLSSFGLKDYASFISKFAFKRIGNEANSLIDLNQLMIKKDFFLKNLSSFQHLAKKENFQLINEENTAFVSIPLVSIKKIKIIEYEKMKKAFDMKFQNNLFSLIHQKKILISSYPYLLTLKSLFGKKFIIKFLKETIKNKNSLEKLSANKIYLSNSPVNKIKDIFYKDNKKFSN